MQGVNFHRYNYSSDGAYLVVQKLVVEVFLLVGNVLCLWKISAGVILNDMLDG